MTKRQETSLLRALARLHGIQTSYVDVGRHRVVASDETLRALLLSLGVPAGNRADLEASWRGAAEDRLRRGVDDVVVAWNGVLGCVDCFVPEASREVRVSIELEDGGMMPLDTGTRAGAVEDGGRPGYRRLRLHAGERLPLGYHRLVCERDGVRECSLLLSAPVRCYEGEAGDGRQWGLFAPLYALRSATDSGAGSYSGLSELARYTGHLGGGMVGTLPLLPCYFEEGSELSPYVPVSRLLWSEFYIDVDLVPTMPGCAEAAHVLYEEDVVRTREGLRQSSRVDYIAVQRFKRSVLRAMYQRVAHNPTVQSSIDAFLAVTPHAGRCAAFLAARGRLQAEWRDWPEAARRGDLSGLAPHEERRVHEFAQWLAHEQVSGCVARAKSDGVGLYLDLPVGVHPDGYDTWQFPDSFLGGAVTGAPPDIVFTTGQRWGSPPLHPEGIRRQHYDYVRQYLAHHMRAARILRVDHVMGLHRIYCIPDGAEPSAGVYLRYRPEEWYAILSIEAHRHKTVLVGEDLGLVPGTVRRAMARHRLNRMFVLYYEMDGIAAGRAPEPPLRCLASLNTHDMPPFASMWQALDICEHERIGIVQPEQVAAAVKSRRKVVRAFRKVLSALCPEAAAGGLEDVLRCTLGWLGEGRSRYVMVNVEDLWLETGQQNVPGVGSAYPSWRQRTALTLEQMWRDPRLERALELLRTAMGRSPLR